MADAPNSGCDVDDLFCRMTALAHLKGLKSALGDEKYREEFPELQSLDEKITSREVSLREAMEECTKGLEKITRGETEPLIPAEIIESEVTE